MNNNLKPSEKICSPFMYYCQKVIPLAFDESMSYYEQLCNLVYYLKNTVMPAVNNNADALTEVQNAYKQLEKYVNDYFKNLDVQTEINNKLDEMAQSGQLTEIVSQYLQISGILAFNTISDMKTSVNLINGSFTKTYGKESLLDGKGRFYKVRTIQNTDVVDEVNIIALNDPNLIAELIPEDTELITNLQNEINTNTESITNLQNEINTNTESITNLQNKINITNILKNKKTIIIGDSLSLNGGWGIKFINISQCNGENYGNGSAGFLSKGITSPYENMDFNDMLDYIIANKTNEELSEIQYLIVGGGINDALNNYSPTNISIAVQNFINKAKLKFINAKIIIIPLHTFKWLSSIQIERYSSIINTAKNNGIQTTDDFLFWTVDNREYDSGDQIHLTDTGYEVLANKILCYLNNGTINTYEEIKYTLNENWTIPSGYNFQILKKGNIVQVCGILKYNGGGISGTTPILDFENGIYVTGGSTFSKYIPAVFYASGNESFSTVNVVNGKLETGRPLNYSSLSSPHVYINGTFPIGLN